METDYSNVNIPLDEALDLLSILDKMLADQTEWAMKGKTEKECAWDMCGSLWKVKDKLNLYIYGE